MKKIKKLIDFLDNSGFKKEASFLRKEALGLSLLGMIFGIGCNKAEDLVLCTKYIEYEVKKGDTLYSIYKKHYGEEFVNDEKVFGILIDAFKFANQENIFEPIDPNTLHIGDIIKIPDPDDIRGHYEEIKEKYNIDKEDVLKNPNMTATEIEEMLKKDPEKLLRFKSAEISRGKKTPSNSALAYLVQMEKVKPLPYHDGADEKGLYSPPKPPTGGIRGRRVYNKNLDTIGVGHLFVYGKDKIHYVLTTETNSKGVKYPAHRIVGYTINGNLYGSTKDTKVEGYTSGRKPDYELTGAEINKIFKEDVARKAKETNLYVSDYALSQNEFDAFFTFTYNTRSEWPKKFSGFDEESDRTLKARDKYFKDGKITNQKEWDRITKIVFDDRIGTTTGGGRGLFRRRYDELKMSAEGDYEETTYEDWNTPGGIGDQEDKRRDRPSTTRY